MRNDRPRRLDGISYIGFQRYFLTICTAFKCSVFTEDAIVADIRSQLLQTTTQFEFEITAYCFMPDHLHALLTATSEQADFRECVRRFKQLTGYRFRKNRQVPLWQPGYYEHIVRDDESSEAIVRYILENPIRAGLSKEIGEYPFAGSEVYDIKSLLTAWENRPGQN